MAQFDVHRNPGQQKEVIPYVVVVQSSRFERSHRRVVVPLMLESAVGALDPTLLPSFTVERRKVVMNPLQIASMPTEGLGKRVGTLEKDADRVIAALDLLLSRAWD